MLFIFIFAYEDKIYWYVLRGLIRNIENNFRFGYLDPEEDGMNEYIFVRIKVKDYRII